MNWKVGYKTMNSVMEEILLCYGSHEYPTNDCLYLEDELLHYGMPFRSGRYPYGSGDNPFQHSRDFLGRIEELKKQGFTYTDENGKTWTGDNAIAKSMGLTSTEYRRQVTWAAYERRLQQVETAKRLRDKEGMGPTEIGREMGISESTVRSLLNPKREERMQQLWDTVNFLKAEGYPLYAGGIPQINTKGQQSNQQVLCIPGTPYKDIYDYDKVKTITEYASKDGGKTFETFQYPASIDPKRVKVLLKDEIGPDGEPGVA